MIKMLVMGEYRLLFWQSAKTYKFYGTLKFLLTRGHMGLKMSKSYSSYSFHLWYYVWVPSVIMTISNMCRGFPWFNPRPVLVNNNFKAHALILLKILYCDRVNKVVSELLQNLQCPLSPLQRVQHGKLYCDAQWNAHTWGTYHFRI